METRKQCEMCNTKLEIPETDNTKIAICKKCMKGQLEGFSRKNQIIKPKQ